MLDQRVFSRYKVNFNCTFAVEGQFPVYEARILDLSLTGMRLLVPYPVEVTPGQKVQFCFSSRPPVKGKARIVWTQETNSGLMIGLEIIELPLRFREALQQVINELALYYLTDAYLR